MKVNEKPAADAIQVQAGIRKSRTLFFNGVTKKVCSYLITSLKDLRPSTGLYDLFDLANSGIPMSLSLLMYV